MILFEDNEAPTIVLVDTVLSVRCCHAPDVNVPPFVPDDFSSRTIIIGYGAANHPAVTKFVTVTDEAETVVAARVVVFSVVTVPSVAVIVENVTVDVNVLTPEMD